MVCVMKLEIHEVSLSDYIVSVVLVTERRCFFHTRNNQRFLLVAVNLVQVGHCKFIFSEKRLNLI